ncbi:hypothetical protein MBLNU459_g2119t1 [Dothideomycetes sp. NU459]
MSDPSIPQALLALYARQEHRPAEGLQRLTIDVSTPHAVPDQVDRGNALLASPTSATSAGSSSQSEAKAPWKTAFAEARHFVGGLVAHPHESTKHFSVLRHSHGIVYYQGPRTSVAITIFSAEPLPANRTIWLQKKGWLGKTGWAARSAIGAKGSWIDVTPDRTAAAESIQASDERAWQRDISKFLKKAQHGGSNSNGSSSNSRHHAVRETDVVRIPDTELGDGYFRLVLCGGAAGKKVLCPSPVFRVASLSSSSASFKGASLGTLPLELGVKAASVLTSSHVSAVTQPVTAAIQGQCQQYMPGFWTQEAGSLAYGATGAQGRVDEANAQYAQARGLSFDRIAANDTKNGEGPVCGPSEDDCGPALLPDGPAQPFPLHIESTIVKGTGRSSRELGMATANLAAIPSALRYRLSGVYFGWARIHSPRDRETTTAAAAAEPAVAASWTQTLITFAPCPYSAPAVVAPEKTAKAYLIADLLGGPFFGARISVVVMGFVRPATAAAASLEQICADVAFAQHVLGMPGWGVDDDGEAAAAAAAAKQDKKQGPASIVGRYVAAREAGQRQVDWVPLQRVGIRTEAAGLRDKSYERGGICIPR